MTVGGEGFADEAGFAIATVALGVAGGVVLVAQAEQAGSAGPTAGAAFALLSGPTACSGSLADIATVVGPAFVTIGAVSTGHGAVIVGTVIKADP